ncbi:DNA repair protein [Diplocarpon rosae]|nr:DNA repair protein [Diplocarpon rosae]
MNHADYLREREERKAERARVQEEDREIYRYLMAYTTPMPVPKSPAPAPDNSRLMTKHQSSGKKPNLSEFLAMDHLEVKSAPSICYNENTIPNLAPSTHHSSETVEDVDEKLSADGENLRLQDDGCPSPNTPERFTDIPARPNSVLKEQLQITSVSLVDPEGDVTGFNDVEIVSTIAHPHTLEPELKYNTEAKGHLSKISKTSPSAGYPGGAGSRLSKRKTSAVSRTIAHSPTPKTRAQPKTPHICKEQRQRWQRAVIMARASGSPEDLTLWRLDARDYRPVYEKHHHELALRLSAINFHEDGLRRSGSLDTVATWISRGRGTQAKLEVLGNLQQESEIPDSCTPTPRPWGSRVSQFHCFRGIESTTIPEKTDECQSLANTYPVIRAIGIALYRSLLEQCIRIPLPADLLPRGPVHPIKHFIRKKFRQNFHHTSPRLVYSALKTGYTAEQLIHAASTGNQPALAQVHDLLRLLDAQTLAGREACTQPVPRDLKRLRASVRAIPGAAKVSEIRPLPLARISNVRHVPSLVVATWLPFLRFKRPQSPYLSRVLKAKITQKNRRLQRLDEMTEMVEMGDAEDIWDDIVLKQTEKERGVEGVMEMVQAGWDEGDSWRTESQNCKWFVSRSIEREHVRASVLGKKLLGIVEREKELWAEEKKQRKWAKNKKKLVAKQARMGAVEGQRQDTKH